MKRKIDWNGRRFVAVKNKRWWEVTIKGVDFVFWKSKGATPWKSRRKTDPIWVVLWADTTLANCVGVCHDDFA